MKMEYEYKMPDLTENQRNPGPQSRSQVLLQNTLLPRVLIYMLNLSVSHNDLIRNIRGNFPNDH